MNKLVEKQQLEKIEDKDYVNLIQSMIKQYASNLTVEEMQTIRETLNQEIYAKRKPEIQSSIEWNFESGF